MLIIERVVNGRLHCIDISGVRSELAYSGMFDGSWVGKTISIDSDSSIWHYGKRIGYRKSYFNLHFGEPDGK